MGLFLHDSGGRWSLPGAAVYPPPPPPSPPCSRRFASLQGFAFTIHHPDPWWKKRHRKRRLVQTHLVEQLARLLVPGGWVFLQTDVPDMADQIRSTFAANPLFRSTDAVAIQATRMGGLQSHREKKCQQLGIPVTRLAYVLENKERIAS